MSEEQLNEAMEIAKTNAMISIAQSLSNIEGHLGKMAKQADYVFTGIKPVVDLVQENKNFIMSLPALLSTMQQ